MKAWSTFFFILSIIMIILSLFGLVYDLALFVILLSSSIMVLFMSAVCKAVFEHLEHQKTAIRGLKEIYKNQQKLIILLDNRIPEK